MKRVTFYSPNTVLGGTEVVFARLGGLLSTMGYTVRAIDRSDGVLAALAQQRWPDATCTVFTERSLCCPDSLIDSDWLITTPKYLVDLLRGGVPVHDRTRVIFYQLHPLEWISALYPGYFRFHTAFGARIAEFWRQALTLSFSGHGHFVGDFLEGLIAAGGLSFMDGPTQDFTIEHMKLSGRGDGLGHLLPLLAEDRRARSRQIFEPRLRAYYFGRISDFKTKTIIRLIDDLANISSEAKGIDLFVIGFGDDLAMVQKRATAVQSSVFTVSFVGAMPLMDAQAAMANDADIVFAMGSSALDAAVMGIPTAIINPLGTNAAEHLPYAGWLHDQLNHSVGSYDLRRYSKRPATVSTLVNELLSGKSPEAAMRSYVVSQHGSEAVAIVLAAHLSRCNLTVGSVRTQISNLRLLTRMRKQHSYKLIQIQC